MRHLVGSSVPQTTSPSSSCAAPPRPEAEAAIASPRQRAESSSPYPTTRPARSPNTTSSKSSYRSHTLHDADVLDPYSERARNQRHRSRRGTGPPDTTLRRWSKPGRGRDNNADIDDSGARDLPNRRERPPLVASLANRWEHSSRRQARPSRRRRRTPPRSVTRTKITSLRKSTHSTGPTRRVGVRAPLEGDEGPCSSLHPGAKEGGIPDGAGRMHRVAAARTLNRVMLDVLLASAAIVADAAPQLRTPRMTTSSTSRYLRICDRSDRVRNFTRQPLKGAMAGRRGSASSEESTTRWMPPLWKYELGPARPVRVVAERRRLPIAGCGSVVVEGTESRAPDAWNAALRASTALGRRPVRDRCAAWVLTSARSTVVRRAAVAGFRTYQVTAIAFAPDVA